MDRRTLVFGLASLPMTARAAGKAEFYPVPVELLSGLATLQGTVALGNPNADVTLVEFFDYNCPFCKGAARDIRPLLSANRDLAVVLVNYAVLGIPSIGATRVALAFSRQKPTRYLDFHERLFALRGTHGPEQAIDIALKLGANRAKLEEDADSDAVTTAMRDASQLGTGFGFQATPSYLIGRDAFAGYLDRAQKQEAVAAFRKCERAACE
jgi:protein-disulfide isomerase